MTSLRDFLRLLYNKIFLWNTLFELHILYQSMDWPILYYIHYFPSFNIGKWTLSTKLLIHKKVLAVQLLYNWFLSSKITSFLYLSLPLSVSLKSGMLVLFQHFPCFLTDFQKKLIVNLLCIPCMGEFVLLKKRNKYHMSCFIFSVKISRILS